MTETTTLKSKQFYYHPYPQKPIYGLTRVTDPRQMLVAKLSEETKWIWSVEMPQEFLEAGLADREQRRKFWQDENNFPYKSAKETIAASYLPTLLDCQKSIGYKLSRKFSEQEVAPDQTRRIEWDTAAVRGDWLHYVIQEALAESGLVAPNPTYQTEDDLDDIGEQPVANSDGKGETKKASDAETMSAKLQAETIRKWLIEADLAKLLPKPLEPNSFDFSKLPITGRVDGVAFLNGELIHLEIKSVASKNWDDQSKYFSKQLKLQQARIYQHLTKLPKTRFVVVRRECAETGVGIFDPENWMEFDYVGSSDTELPSHQTENILKLVEETIRRKEHSRANPGYKQMNCRFCGFKAECLDYQLTQV